MIGKSEFRKANFEELRLFYDWMKQQFHPGELKSLPRIEQMCLCDRYCAYGLWNGEELIAYALMANTSSVETAIYLLDYYAVLPQYQDAGWGSRFLEMLRANLRGDAIIFEVEDPDYAPDEEERAHWQRRIRFYEKNGCTHTPVKLNLYGFDYTIMQLPIAQRLYHVKVRKALEEIYHVFSPPKMYEENVHFRELILPPVERREWTIGKRRVACFCCELGAPALYVHSSVEEAELLARDGWTVVAIDGIDWNHDLSPWRAKTVFRGQPDFGGGAREYLRELKDRIIPTVEADIQPYCRAIMGYSLAGLFAVYAALETGMFDSVASVSGSMWYPGFAEYAENAQWLTGYAYFSVGDKEKNSRNAAFRSIEDCTSAVIRALRSRGTETMFERNPGTHFDDPAGRMLKAARWMKARVDKNERIQKELYAADPMEHCADACDGCSGHAFRIDGDE